MYGKERRTTPGHMRLGEKAADGYSNEKGIVAVWRDHLGKQYGSSNKNASRCVKKKEDEKWSTEIIICT
jgi:hypothetical protein